MHSVRDQRGPRVTHRCAPCSVLLASAIAAASSQLTSVTRLSGPPCLNFEAAMSAEHCTMGGCDYEFTYPLLMTTTTPRQEWFHVVSFNGGQHLHQSDMSSGRRLLSIDECLQKSAAKRAGLNRAEIIALIMFTGPMVIATSRFISFLSAILHRKRLPPRLPRRVSPVTIFHADSHLQSNITPVPQGAVRVFRKSRQSVFFHYLRILFSHGQAVPRLIVDGGDQSVQRCTYKTG